MAVERKHPGWAFWGRWVLASAAGFGFGSFLGMSLAWAVVGVVATGTVEGTPEFFSLLYLDVKANGTYEQWHDLKYGAFYAPGGDLIVLTVAIAAGGFMQWLVLRGHVGWARWWALPAPLWVGFVSLMDDPAAVGGGVTLLAYYAKDFAILGALLGAILGIPLVWFLRRSYSRVLEAEK